MLKLITWNINSVRLRLGLLKQLIDEEQPDIICLQETKVRDELFPLADIQSFGYPHIYFRGEKSYNGVAILSKIPLQLSEKLHLATIDDARHLAVTLPCGTELHNLYIPAGGDEPDVTINPKFKHKLEVVDYLTQWFREHRSATKPIIAVGDFNIAPYEHDVWSHKQLLTVVSHTPIEVEKLSQMKASLGWIDTARHFVDSSEKLYSWWSYRNRDWKKSNRGRRLDHIWVTPVLTEKLHSYHTKIPARDWEKPSDHVPIMLCMS